MSSEANLLLEAIGLARQAQGDGLLFEANGALHRQGSAASSTAALKFGQGGTISTELKALFPAAQDPPAGEGALWFTMPPTGAPANGKPAWLGIFRKSQLELHGSVPLEADAVTLPGLLNFGADLRLTTEVVLVGSAVKKARFRVEGSATLIAALGPLQPAGLHVNRIELELDVDDLPELGSVVDEPAALLDGAFRGTLVLDASVSGLTLGALTVGGGTATLRLGVSSKAATRKLDLEVLDFNVASPAPLTLLGGANHLSGLSITQVELSGHLTGPDWQAVHLQGAGKMALPTLLWSALDSASGQPGALLDASFDLRHTSTATGEHTVLEAGVHGLRLTPSDALLALPTADLKTLLRSDGGVWSLSVTGEASVGWEDLAHRLAAAGAAALPAAPAMPELHVVTKVVLDDSGSSGSASLSLDLRRTGAESVPFDGQLGPLPVAVSSTNLVLEAAFDAQGIGSWSVAGSGRLSTLGALRQVMPVSGAQFTLDVHGDGVTLPRLRFRVAGGLPPLTLPSFDGSTIDILALKTLDLELGEAVEISGTVALARPQPQALASKLGLPNELTQLAQRLGQALPNSGTFALHVPLDHASAPLSVDIVLRPSNPPRFRLLEELGKLVDSQQAGPTPATRIAGLSVPPTFFDVAAGELRLSATLADSPTVLLSAALDCSVMGETFDTTLTIGVQDGEFDLAVMAGMQDPITITVPIPDPKRMLGTADVQAIANAYGLNSTQRQALAQVKQHLDQLADELGPQGTFAFEIREFGLRVRADGPTLSGDVRLVQLPRLLDLLTPLTDMKLGLGSEIDKLFIDVEFADSNDPLVTIPVPGDVDVDVFVGRFMLAYAWGHDEFAFALDARVVPSKTLNLTAGGSGVYLPAVKADVQLGATATAPPVPIPEGVFSFERAERAPTDKAVDQLGLQAVIGSGQTRFVTAYLRELAFSPTYFLLWPGLRVDAGLTLGGPNPRTLAGADDYLNVRANWDRSAFFARFTLKHTTVIFMDPSIGFLLNPLAFVPPFVTANPPYWIAPPQFLGDIYADEIGVSANIPGLVFLDLTFERPMPSFSLQALLEFAALAAGGFSQKIPATSPLRKVFYTRLSFLFDLRVAGLSPAGTTAADTVEVNVADLINGLIDVMQKAKKTLEAGSDLVHEIEQDPSLLVRMIPRDKRTVQHAVDLAGFRFSGSVYLLTPDELHDELVLFFENKRRKPRGLAANQTPPDPPPTHPVNLAATPSASRPITRKEIVDSRSIAPSSDFLLARSLPVALKQQKALAKQIEAARAEQDQNATKAAAAIATALAKLPPDDAAGRKALLQGIGLGDSVAPVEAEVTRSPRGGRRVDSRAVTSRVRVVLAEAVGKRDESLVADEGLTAPPEELAARVVAKITAPPAAVPPGPGPRPISRPDTRRALETLPAIARDTPAVASAVGGLQRTLSASRLAATARRNAVAAAEAKITSALSTTYSVQHGKLEMLDTLKGDASVLTDDIRGAAPGAWRAVERVTSRVVEVGVFDAQHFAGQLGKIATLVPPPPPPGDTVETVDGYEIRIRGSSSGAGFAVPLPTAEAPYKVELRASRYGVYVLQNNGAWKGYDLPAALVGSIPESPDKPRLLRDRLVIAPRIVKRPRTQAEKAAVADQWEQSTSLYLTSLLARPEYQVKSTGGIHGPFYVADLLRNPATGAYTVPASPALLGGFKTTLFGQELALAGLIVPGKPMPSAFLYAHAALDVTLAGLHIAAEGDFAASAGPLWQNLPLPSGTTAPQNVIAFDGSLSLTRGTNKLLEGSTTGEFTRDAGGATHASLKVDVASQGVIDLGIDDAKFARITWSLVGETQLAVSPQAASASISAKASVAAELATYGIKWVEDIPPKTFCIPWYYVNEQDVWKSYWGWKCWTTPAVTHPEINFSTIVWTELADANCSVHASSANGLSFSLDLTPLGAAVTNLLGTTSVPLPNLL